VLAEDVVPVSQEMVNGGAGVGGGGTRPGRSDHSVSALGSSIGTAIR
jgi:hypothetical protein